MDQQEAMDGTSEGLGAAQMDVLKALRKENPAKARKLQRQWKRKLQKKTEVKTETKSPTRDMVIEASSTDEVDFSNAQMDSAETTDVEEQPISAELQDVIDKFCALDALRGGGRHFGGLPDEDEIFYDPSDDRLSADKLANIDAFSYEDGQKEKAGMSAKKLKKLMRPTVSQLKQLCCRPEVVESWDTTAPDPHTLVFLKSYRNTVPVPAHWSHKRKYLQGKRGLEKTMFRLPHYIEATRIAEIRSAIEQKDAQKTLKQKMRERVRPRHRKMNIDYQVLHDAFFKYATKPTYTKFGDLYFEGKETEMQMRKYSPGKLTERAREALGMTNILDPPPWLLNMQRYGPPPSYPNLIISGVNAHIPEGATLGFQVGGWGRIPSIDQLRDWGVTPRFDEAIGGDGIHVEMESTQQLWGALQDLQSSEDEEEAEEKELLDIRSGMETPGGLPLGGTSTPVAFDPSGISSVASTSMLLGSAMGIASVTSGLETPQSVDIAGFMSSGSAKHYTILDQQQVAMQGGALFGSDKIYTMPTGPPQGSSAMLGGLATPFTTNNNNSS